MLRSAHRTRWVLAAIVALALGGVVLAVRIQHQQQERLVAQCRSQRISLANYRRDVFEPRLGQMRQIRLNETQSRALRDTDLKAFIAYSALYGQKVEAVAQASEHLADLAGAFTALGCLDVGP